MKALIHSLNSDDMVVKVKFDVNSVYLLLADGRSVGNPLAWHSWLQHASNEQRSNVEMYELSVYFPDLDDGLDVTEMMKGIPPNLLRRQQERIG